MICIYRWVNVVNNKSLVGQTKNSNRRRLEHIYKLRKKNHSNSYFQRAWNKYGEDNFRFEILEEISSLDLLTLAEQKWVDYYRNATGVYNNLGPVDHPRRGIPLSTSHKEKISKANKGKIRSQQSRDNISKAQIGRKWPPRTEAHTDNLRRSRLGRKIKQYSEESKIQRSIMMTKRNHNAKGYYYDKRDNKFVATIKHLKKRITLGYFDTEIEAREAYLKARQALSKEINNETRPT